MKLPEEELKQRIIDLVNNILQSDTELGLYSAGEYPRFSNPDMPISSYSYEIAKTTESIPCYRITLEILN